MVVGGLPNRDAQKQNGLFVFAALIQQAAELIVPFRVAGFHAAQDLAGAGKLTRFNEKADVAVFPFAGRLAGRSRMGYARVVRAVDIYHFLLGPRALRPLRKAIRVPFASQLAVGLANLGVGRGVRYAEKLTVLVQVQRSLKKIPF